MMYFEKNNEETANITAENKKSPYSVCEEDILEKVMPMYSGYIELNRLQQQILRCINERMMLTVWQVSVILKKNGIYHEQDELQNELWKLSNNCYLDKYRLFNPANNMNFNVYKIGHKGKGWLKRVGEKPRMGGYLERCRSVQIKKLLSVNQCIIGLNLTSEYKIETTKMIYEEGRHIFRKNKNLFRAGGIAENDSSILIIESVRSDEDFEGNLIEKLQRIDKTIKKGKCSINKHKSIRLLVIAEDKDKMDYLRYILQNHKYRSFEILYSFDWQVTLGTTIEKLMEHEADKTEYISGLAIL